MGCLDDLTVTNLVGNVLAEPERGTALAHLDECATCYELVAAIGSPRAAGEAARLAPGVTVGRYVVERIAGAGAMGIVYAARDPSLERTVALKCIAGPGDPRARDRMIREAKAMAQLSHRNVVTVFDVGEHDDDVFFAMELVAGRTLRDWLAERTRSVREVVAVLADAGRGLAAAHAAGIVHRDFKPDNVLIAGDGRALVTDFGLARADGTVEPAPDAAVVDLTVTGQVIGTPVYMAPELLAGGAATPASDQYSFSVVAYEALTGGRPFEGKTLGDLRTAIARGPVLAEVPAHLRRVLARGLAADPAERFDSLDALLAELVRDPATRRRRLLGGFGALLVIIALVLAVARRREQACTDPRGRLAGAWDDATRARLVLAFAPHAEPYVPSTILHTTEALDRYADHWVDLRRAACRATYVTHDQSEARYDAIVACFDRRRTELAAVTALLADAPDLDTIRHATAIAGGLTDLAPCRDGATLVEQPPLPAQPVLRAQVEAVQRSLASARALGRAGKYVAAEQLVTSLIPQARTLGYAPLLGDLLLALGKLEPKTNRDGVATEKALQEAAQVAAAAKDDVLAAKVWIQLVYTLADLENRFAEADSMAKVARAATQRAGDPPEELVDWHNAAGVALLEEGKGEAAVGEFRGALALAEAKQPDRVSDQVSKLATVLDRAGHYDEARTYGARAVDLLTKELGPGHPDVAFALATLGAIDYDAGRYADSLADGQRALAIDEALGETTYQTTEVLEGIGNAYLSLGKPVEAERYHRRVLAMREVKGPDEPHVADELINIGMDVVEQGKVDEARADYDRALAIYRKVYGPNHPMVATALRQRAQLEMKTDAAVTDLEEALRITVAAVGPDKPEVGIIRGNLAGAYSGVKRFHEAVAQYEQAIAIQDKTLGVDHPFTGVALAGLGQVYLELHDTAHAIPVLERSLKIAEKNPQPTALGLAHYVLARAYDQAGDKTKAKTAADAARAELADAKDPTSMQIKDVLAVMWR
jgi:tetratricopeptide (TPR) repeat protein/predicted Ser/Thr protein kinase